MKKPLYIPKNKRFPGLVVYCLKCRTNMREECKLTGNALKDCPFGEKHRFKIYVQIPGTTQRVTKTFESRNLEEVLKEAKIFRESVIKNNPKTQQIAAVQKSQTEEKQVVQPEQLSPLPQIPKITNDNLLALQAKYLTFISGDESVPLHLRKSRSIPYVSEIEHCFRILIDCLKQKNYDVASMRAGDISKAEVGNFFEYLKSEKEYSNRSINKNISFMRTFYHWLVKHEGLQVTNPFLYVIKLPEYHNPLAITKEEFDALLEKTTKENGIEKCNGVKSYRNMYRYWLKDAYKLSLFTGRRREEIINFRWSDIIKDEFKNPILIASEDRKVNNIQHRTEEHQKKINYVPITSELLEVLKNCGYEKLKDGNAFILAPELKVKRNKSMSDVISRGFSHFLKLTNPKRELKFKSIRKAYLTNLQIFTGNAKAISGHSGNAVLEQHYWDKAVIAQSLRNFQVFGNKEQSRLSEINVVRENQKQQEVSLEK